MTAKEALWLVKMQLPNTYKNDEVIKVLEGLINLPARHIDDEPQTLEELFDSYENPTDFVKYKMVEFEEPRSCARYELAEDDEEEDTSHALDHMFGNVLEDLDKLKIKKGDK
jgi:hypothetical protein